MLFLYIIVIHSITRLSLAKITFSSANDLYSRKKYSEAFEQFCYLAEMKINPAFSTFLAGNALFLSSNNIKDTFSWYTKALHYDDSNSLINREIEHFTLTHGLTDPEKQILWHYFPNTPNIGDSGSAAGIRACINSLTDNCSFLTLSCRNDNMNAITKLDSNCSGIIIGGGGLYFQQPTSSGWYFPLSLQQTKGLNIPIISYAVGFNKEYSDDASWDLNDNFIQKIAQFNNNFTLKSVRDKWSKELLEKNGASNLFLVPCPSAFLKPLFWYKMSINKTDNIVGISITDRSTKNEKKTQLFNTFIELAKWLKNHSFVPLFILQDSTDDLQLAEMIIQNGYQCIIPNTAREAVSIYSQCNFVVGMRGHSLIMAAGQCVPILAISYNKKVDAFMELVGLKDYCINQDKIDTCDDLISAFEKLVDQKDTIISKLEIKKDLFHKMIMDYTKKVIKILQLN